MKFHEQKIKGVFIIEAEPFEDERGIFRRHFCQKEFKAHHIKTNVAQANVSENKYRLTLRGFHYQAYPYGEGKTMSCLKGAMYDIILDLRPKSPTYLQWISVELTEENRKSLHVPPGCANAFITLKDNTIIQYYVSQFYTPKAEKGVRFNDPLFKFVWPHKPKYISDKDKNHPDFIPVKK